MTKRDIDGKTFITSFYKEHRTNDQNKNIYNFLRLCKIKYDIARRVRHWSIPNIIKYINHHSKYGCHKK